LLSGALVPDFSPANVGAKSDLYGVAAEYLRQ
jgi:hypothetical protein